MPKGCAALNGIVRKPNDNEVPVPSAAMVAHFSIVAKPDRDLVRIVLSGFSGLADVERFDIARAAAYRGLNSAPNQHVTLCDVSAMKIQAQDGVAAFTKVVGDPRTRSRKLAFITGTSLARLQAQRTATRPSVAYFKDAAAAEAWLFANDASIAA